MAIQAMEHDDMLWSQMQGIGLKFHIKKYKLDSSISTASFWGKVLSRFVSQTDPYILLQFGNKITI